ncbi:MAG TPA: thiamine pyrophosphate-dependent enzyme [Candidatus Woesebacteria bacterium]|nr:thiamine pyrophosphate-dependent enzyme [Candidatus Woesebacteria bacterium]HNS94584.1 thiamine pyrophosphate-dependent enzyme [Candidatus Woesebacteria bacterium]
MNDTNLLIKDLTGYPPTWCPGCGNFGIIRAIRLALAQQNLTPSDIFVTFDIGCSGNMNDFLNANSMHTLHGRAIATAIGIKLAHHTKPVLVVGGDGGLYGEGGNHFLHACRGNHDLTIIVHDNMVYGLTTGQVAPTANKGYKSRSTPSGIIETPINALALAISQGATFVAQTFANDAKHMAEMITKGMQHKGFSVINILQPCVTFNKINTFEYFLKRSYKLVDHDAHNMHSAIIKSLEAMEEKFPLGVLYENKDRLPFHEELLGMDGNDTLLSSQRYTDYDILTQRLS